MSEIIGKEGNNCFMTLNEGWPRDNDTK